MSAWLTVVGIGEDGSHGLGRPRAACVARRVGDLRRRTSSGDAARAARRARACRGRALFDSRRLLAERGKRACACWRAAIRCCSASARRSRRQLPASELRVLPAPSSLSLAAARLGWPLQDVATVSLVGRPLPTL